SPIFSHEGPIHFAQLSPDGRLVVTVGADHSVRVWDASTGRPVTPFLPHSRRVAWVSFSRGGQHLVTETENHVVRLWDLQKKAAIRAELPREAGTLLAWANDGTKALALKPGGI